MDNNDAARNSVQNDAVAILQFDYSVYSFYFGLETFCIYILILFS